MKKDEFYFKMEKKIHIIFYLLLKKHSHYSFSLILAGILSAAKQCFLGNLAVMLVYQMGSISWLFLD